jgi:hypothetical protein
MLVIEFPGIGNVSPSILEAAPPPPPLPGQQPPGLLGVPSPPAPVPDTFIFDRLPIFSIVPVVDPPIVPKITYSDGVPPVTPPSNLLPIPPPTPRRERIGDSLMFQLNMVIKQSWKRYLKW